MGLTYAQIKITGKRGSRELNLLVDTGSLFTWIDERVLRAIGVDPSSTKKFRTIEGKEISRKVGNAVIEIKGEKAPRIVVFGETTDAQVVGTDSLEGLGFEVDPTTKELKHVESFLAV